MIKTGIYQMDSLLDGGIPEGKSLVYYIQPGVNGEIFGLQTIHNAMKTGGSGVYIVSSMSPDVVKDQIKEFGWCYDIPSDNLVFVDSYNPLIGVLSNEKYVVPNPFDIEDFKKNIEVLLEEMPPSTVVFGSLSTIMDLCGEKETIDAVRIWNDIGKSHGHIMIYNFTAWSYSSETMDQIKKQLFNAVITVGAISDYVIFSQYFGILKIDWKKETNEKAFFKTESNDCLADSVTTIPAPCLEYEINGANVRVIGDNYGVGFPIF